MPMPYGSRLNEPLNCSWVYVSMCVCDCVPLNHILPLERLFVLKILSRTQWARGQKFVGFSPPFSLKPLRCREVKKFVGNRGQKVVGFSLKLLRCTPTVESHTYSQPFSCGKRTCALESIYRGRYSFVLKLPLVMPPSKVCPQWHELMTRRHFSAFICTYYHLHVQLDLMKISTHILLCTVNMLIMVWLFQMHILLMFTVIPSETSCVSLITN